MPIKVCNSLHWGLHPESCIEKRPGVSVCAAAPHSIPELGAPQSAHTLPQKHCFPLFHSTVGSLSSCSTASISLAVGIHSFYCCHTAHWHFSKLNLVGSLLPTLCHSTVVPGHSTAPWEVASAVGKGPLDEEVACTQSVTASFGGPRPGACMSFA